MKAQNRKQKAEISEASGRVIFSCGPDGKLSARDVGEPWRILKGLPHQSPGLVRRAPTLGSPRCNLFNPERVESRSRRPDPHDGFNPFRVGKILNRPPRVATASQPWAVGWNPFRILEGGTKNLRRDPTTAKRRIVIIVILSAVPCGRRREGTKSKNL